LEQLRRALFKLPVVFWLVEVALVGASMSLVDNFLFVYLQNDLQASTVLCGWTVGVTVLFELPIFWSSKFLLQKVGHDGLFLTSLLAYSTRVFGYTLLRPSTIYWVFPLEVLHGITFACAVVASVDYSTAISPKEWSTTVQSILSTVMSCVGGGLGPILGGIVANEYGFVVLYRGAGYVTAAASLVHVGLWMCGMGHGAFLERLAKEAGPKDEHVYVGIKKLVSPNASLYMCIISISIAF
jgi:MFS family permease